MLQFSVLWEKHPANQTPSIISPCANDEGTPNFENQCAIRMGVCLAAAGADISSFRGTTCWHGHGRNHVLRAQELADYLKTRTDLVGTVKIDESPTLAEYTSRRGVVLFQNFWGTGNQGDHIDVWDGSQMAKGDPSYFAASQAVWFWELS